MMTGGCTEINNIDWTGEKVDATFERLSKGVCLHLTHSLRYIPVLLLVSSARDQASNELHHHSLITAPSHACNLA